MHNMKILARIWKRDGRDGDINKDNDENSECESGTIKNSGKTPTSSTEITSQFDEAKTLFPQFDLPDADLTDTSDDESAYLAKREEKYRTKEDQDVAVFLSLAKRMSIHSLLHILQGQARAKKLSTPALIADAVLILDSAHENSSQEEIKPVVKPKKFRFSEVRDEVREVESWKDMKELWLSQAEISEIRSNVIDTVNFYRRHRPEYNKSLVVVVENKESKSVIEHHLKILTEEWYARGLESHILDKLSGNRRATVEAVLQEQYECKLAGDSEDMMWHCLREQSIAYSQLSSNFSEKIGLSDQIEALKATISRWEVSGPRGVVCSNLPPKLPKK